MTRVYSAATGQILVNIAGLSPEATGAAGRFLADTRSMDAAARTLPAGWEGKNLQLVIQTRQISDKVEPGRLIAAEVW